MTAVLVAGVGNVFHGDDGFGVEVATRLAQRPLPPEVSVRDYGIRALHLAYALLDGTELLIVVDLVARGEAPGTLYLLEPELPDDAGQADPHGMNLSTVLASVRALGGTLPRVLIVGCEPEWVGETMGLSDPVERAVEPAMRLIEEVLARELSAITSGKRREHEEHPETP
jgi:hydrogenase maturation protease